MFNNKKIENKTVVDFWLHVDGLRPTLSGDAGSETLGLSDMLVAHRSFSFTTEHFFNEHYDIVDGAILLEKWLYCPYKFFTIWKYNPADFLYYLTHRTEIGLNMINPNAGVLGGVDTPISYGNVLCVPVKVAGSSIEHKFGVQTHRRYTIDLTSIRNFSFQEVYS